MSNYILSEVNGLGAVKAQTLIKQGIDTVEKLAACDIEQITAIPGFGAALATKILDNAKSMLAVPDIAEQAPVVEETETSSGKKDKKKKDKKSKKKDKDKKKDKKSDKKKDKKKKDKKSKKNKKK